MPGIRRPAGLDAGRQPSGVHGQIGCSAENIMKNKYLIVFCTCPDETVAERLAVALVGEGLAACVTCLPGATSVYAWQGDVHQDREVLLLLKTTGARLATLSARIGALHPYEVPEVVAVEITAGSERYLDWLGQTVAAAD